ncbi:hypothetical protein D8S78_24315 [Natrialba swarupiae]|nr:hypothetical protein [Natrialba swarupiae]
MNSTRPRRRRSPRQPRRRCSRRPPRSSLPHLRCRRRFRQSPHPCPRRWSRCPTPGSPRWSRRCRG